MARYVAGGSILWIRRTCELFCAHMDEPALVELTEVVGVCSLITGFSRTLKVKANR